MSRRANPKYLALEATLKEQLELYLESNHYREKIVNDNIKGAKNKDCKEIVELVINSLRTVYESGSLDFNKAKFEDNNLFNLFDALIDELKEFKVIIEDNVMQIITLFQETGLIEFK